MRFLLVLLDHVTCDYCWRYDMWWSHYWSCNNKWSLSSLEF